MRKISSVTAQRALENALIDLTILDGQIVGPSGASWQDVAGTAALNLHTVANYLEQCRAGHGSTMLDLVFALGVVRAEEDDHMSPEERRELNEKGEG